MKERFDRLVGGKILLRPFLQSDITAEYTSWLNDPEVVRYSNQRFIRHTQTSCRAYWESFRDTPNLFLSVRTLTDDLPVGTMTAYVCLPHGTVDIGILIGQKSLWGAGIGQDAWSALLTWLERQKDVRKITAGTLNINKGMIRIMERSGMQCEAIRSKHEIVGGEICDVLLYAKHCQPEN